MTGWKGTWTSYWKRKNEKAAGPVTDTRRFCTEGHKKREHFCTLYGKCPDFNRGLGQHRTLTLRHYLPHIRLFQRIAIGSKPILIRMPIPAARRWRVRKEGLALPLSSLLMSA